MPWLSAELLLFDLDEDGPPLVRFHEVPATAGGRRVTAEISEAGLMHRSGAAALYRCQAPDPACQCWDCQPRAPRAAAQAGKKSRRLTI